MGWGGVGTEAEGAWVPKGLKRISEALNHVSGVRRKLGKGGIQV